MKFEYYLLISLLKLTANGVVDKEILIKDAKIPELKATELIDYLQNEDLIFLDKHDVCLTGESRVKIALLSLNFGADLECLSKYLHWKEFEDFTSVALEKSGYSVWKNVRFKHEGTRYEIDVIGCRKPLVICIDCKHWSRRIGSSALNKIVQAQKRRTESLAKSLPNKSLQLECIRWGEAKFLPAILSLIPSNCKMVNKVPVFSILQIRDFLTQLPIEIDSFNPFIQTFKTLQQMQT